eukprot:jgi/Phyca11/97315/e_gw1.1.531.1
MINFIDFKSNYCRVFLARTKDAAAKLFEHFLVYFEKEFNCKIHGLPAQGPRGDHDAACQEHRDARQGAEPAGAADKWLAAMADELHALEDNGVWRVVRKPEGCHALNTKWVYKTKVDAEGAIERLKARLVACGNEQKLGVDYSVTFSAVIEMTSVKLILALARKWRVPARHGDVPNAYVKANKEAEHDIYLRIPHGMTIPEDVRRRLGVFGDDELVLEL